MLQVQLHHKRVPKFEFHYFSYESVPQVGEICFGWHKLDPRVHKMIQVIHTLVNFITLSSALVCS